MNRSSSIRFGETSQTRIPVKTLYDSSIENRHMRFTPGHWLIATLLACGWCAAAEPDADAIDFNRDIRPILSDRCYFCHGPDEENQSAGLRLDQRDQAIDVIESGELIDRILSEDPDTVMPPPESNLSLTEAQQETLEKWIEQGAPYAQHWAFEKLSIDVPLIETNSPWVRQPLDEFVLSRMLQHDLTPSPDATPLRWLRRVTLDLTGLPPSVEEIKSFESLLQSDADQAYERVVDRLLRSQGFGEHMAIAWLDAARYADSYGYQSDKLNTQWPYRDWVIRAFNQNLPYDEFLTWQIAGDLLPNPTLDQRLATAFNRVHRLNNEGGAVFEEWRLENVADRVHTFGTAVLGLTMECCRCHDHKYDPIPMRDYYALSAYFNSIDESGVYDRTQKVPCPSVLLPTVEQAETLRKAEEAVRLAEVKVMELRESARTRYASWSRSSEEGLAIPDLQLALSFDQGFDNAIKDVYHPSQSDRAWTKMSELVEVQDSPIRPLEASNANDFQSAKPIQGRMALHLDGERGVTTHGVEPFDRWLPMTVAITLKEQRRSPLRSVIAHHTRGTDCGYNGWDLTIENGHLESRMARVWPGNAISVRTLDPIPDNQWHQVAATYDGSSRARGLKLFLNGRELPTEVVRDELKKSCNVVVDHGGEFVIGQRFRDRGFADGLIDDVRVYGRALTPTELQYLAGSELNETKPDFDYFVSAVDAPSRLGQTELTAARRAWVMAEEAIDEIPVMRELDAPRPTHILARGEYNAPKSDQTLVGRATLSSLPIPFPEDAPNNRLGLARWVTHPEHPLTARVAVNRFWSNFFESPLVGTPENFGSQGELPTHPELLDWLARDFVDSGWDVKGLCKMIVLSATYRQDSASSPERLRADPSNQWLARGPAHRLAAEQIRDLALAASGLLNREAGGPPVSPYQPGEDLWKESNGMSPPYKQSVGQALYRRSLYSVWKRTAPLPNMMAFDSTTREVCTVKRSRTNTPMQALVLLNDIQFVEAARVMAMRITELPQSEQIERAFVRLTGRQPNRFEASTLAGLLRDELAYYEQHPADAKQLAEVGNARLDPAMDLIRVAALTNVCQAILNLDATIWKR